MPVITGDSRANRLNGTNRDDQILGRGGNDTLRAFAGDDFLQGDDGNDVFLVGTLDEERNPTTELDAVLQEVEARGGSDIDTVDTRFADGGVALQLDAQGDITFGGGTLFGGVNGDIGNDGLFGERNNRLNATSIENLFGSRFNDILVGNQDANALNGFSGGDVLFGAGGNDEVDGSVGNDDVGGGTGNDDVLGGGGNDQVLGDEGSDEVRGGRGNDALSGGAGSDTLVGGLGNDTLFGGDFEGAFAGGFGVGQEGNQTQFDPTEDDTPANAPPAGGSPRDPDGGADVFAFQRGDVGDGIDTVFDFNPFTVGEQIVFYGFGVRFNSFQDVVNNVTTVDFNGNGTIDTVITLEQDGEAVIVIDGEQLEDAGGLLNETDFGFVPAGNIPVDF